MSAETEKPQTPAEIQKLEKQRLLALIITKGHRMSMDYKNTIKHTGGLLTTSMTYAYSKGIQDIIKLLSKETK